MTNDVAFGRIGTCAEVPLDQVARFLGFEPEEDVKSVDVTRIQTNGITSLGG